MTAVAEMFRYDPPVSAATVRAWQRDLDRVFPPTDQLSRLVIRWEAGDAWQPIQRWMLWQVQDPTTSEIPPMIRHALSGPHPRATGHYCGTGVNASGKRWCACALKANRWVKPANRFIDRQTWELYQETGLYGRRWWTIQGRKGGHRFLWDPEELEAKLAQLIGMPTQTPDPGDLPYAPFDERVLTRVAQLDQVRAWTHTLEFSTRNVDHLEAVQKADAVKARDALAQWIDWGIEEAWDEGGSAFKQYLSETYGRAEAGETGRDLDYEDVGARFAHVE